MRPTSTAEATPAPLDATLTRRQLVLALGAAGLATSCGGGGSSGGGGGGGDGGGGGGDGGPDVPPAPGVSGPAWWGFGRDAQHAAQGAVATPALTRIAWRLPVDLVPPIRNSGELLAHYGTPVISDFNTVVVPVKTGATGGFRMDARSGTNGGLIWRADSDYVLPAHNWNPAFNISLSAGGTVYAPGAGGKLLLRDQVDSAAGTTRQVVFYGANVYDAAPAALDATVFINTPITLDPQGNAYFGFIALPGNPAGLLSGVARVAANGSAVWRAVTDLVPDQAITKVATNCAPALSPDGRTLYVAANAAADWGSEQPGYLLALSSSTLAMQNARALLDPQTGAAALVTDDASSSPTVGPDGDVFYGVLESHIPEHNDRGWLLHFDATLATLKTPGSFGWDDTASVVPASAVPSYGGTSSYLLVTKYNNYLGIGTGDGLNRMAVLDPHASQVDDLSGLPVMQEVLTILGVTPETPGSRAVKEWCVNTVAIDPLTHAVLVNSEDGWLYRWDLRSNQFTQRIQLTSGIGEAYTPTAIGADGAVYAINRAVLFSVQG
jgi:hypothetical protein